MHSGIAPFPVRLKDAERSFRQQRRQLLEAVRQDPEFLSAGVSLYDFEILDNIECILQLLGDGGSAFLDELPNKTMIDIGCANGDLGFAFEDAGFSVALLDKSHVAEAQGSVVRQNAPLVASIIARNKGSRAVIFDEDIEESFHPQRVIEGFAGSYEGDQQFQRFGLGVMLGVLYHLKNPYSVIEKLGQLCDHLIIGTWVADCLPDSREIIEDQQVVFLLRDRQLAADPTNYWIFTTESLRVLVERCGWQILSQYTATNPISEPQPLSFRQRVLQRLGRRWGVSPPDDVSRRVFMLLKRADQHSED
jgi:tRNA (mo5U34)-methyltransferase